ncbi:MAG: cupin domain-containing protein [Polyangiales bacterium]
MIAVPIPMVRSLFVLGVATALGCGGATPRAGSTPEGTLTLLGHGRLVAMAELELDARSTFHVPTRGCQDVLVLGVEGTAAVAPEGDQEALIEPGLGIRLGHGSSADRTIRARNDHAKVFLVFARPESRPFPDQTTSLELLSPPDCRELGDGTFTLADGSRAGPFLHRGGALRVSIYFDAGHGAEWAGLGLLDADPSVDVPEHVHEGSAEVLYFLDGEGTMRLGEREIAIRPGAFAYVPAGVRHGFRPTGARPLRAYQTYAPSGPEQRFRLTDPAPAN